MKQIGHDFFRERSVWQKEAFIDIKIRDAIFLCQLFYQSICSVIILPLWIRDFFRTQKIARRSILVVGDFVLMRSIIFSTPAAIAFGGSFLWPVLFVPIISTTTFGCTYSNSPLTNRQRTCSVRSPLKPRLSALLF